MTFNIVSVNESRERVVGRIWADGEAHAELLASSIVTAADGSVHVRRSEDCEIPMRIAEPAYTSPFLS